ncbi:MAG: 2-amino-4-hydroxy-6-hydroxymethyldihydropteridine pyrophosphokinase [Firmicutes bacterium]|nr:2-amino-4-hydroxy-6-hydroxymethyldihydropteridine pyrophosphokinase [Bacillota bacterium]
MIFLGLGSNLGDREENINAAITALNTHPAIVVKIVSSIYETAPIGYTDQPYFLNAVIIIETLLSPFALLAECLDIEQALGRIRDQRWGPRTIDIDIVAFDDYECKTQVLTLPHPRLAERGFVLVPLVEIASEQKVCNRKTPAELLAGVDINEITLYKKRLGR